MQIDVDFPGGVRVDAHIGNFTVHTDQTLADGGAETAPSPFDLFLASTAACAGFYVVSFCRKRGIATAGLRLFQRLQIDPENGHVVKDYDRNSTAARLPGQVPGGGGARGRAVHGQEASGAPAGV